MFNNWFNIHDLERLCEKIGRGEARQTLKKIFAGSRQRTREAWKQIENPPLHAWNIPAIQQRWNILVSGAAAVDHVAYISRKYLEGSSSLIAISPGCGAGGNELRWAETGCFARIDAYDLSEPRIANAREKARQKGSENLVHFQVGAMEEISGNDAYNLVLVEGALHHFHPMRATLEKLKKLLKPGGLLIVNEFVGPSRFQWTARQLECANAMLALIPEPYRRKWRSNKIKNHICPPSRLRMKIADPSEAAESALILPLCRELFIPLEEIKKGGTLVNLVFYEIAHHFLQPDETAAKILQTCFAVEDMLMQSGEISSDYIVAVYQKLRA